MKKIIAVLCAFTLAAGIASAQGVLDAFKGLVDVIAPKPNDVDVTGEWTYNGCAIGTMGDNVLSNLAGAAAAVPLEKKIDEALSKVGIKPGIATLSFNSDNTFCLKCGKIKIPGTWSQEGSKVVISFGKLISFLKIEGTAKTSANGINVMFPADDFIDFVDKVMKQVAKITNNTTISTITSLAAQIDGVAIGFKMAKVA